MKKIIQFLYFFALLFTIASCNEPNTLKGWEPIEFGMTSIEVKQAIEPLGLKLANEKDDYLKYEYVTVAGLKNYSVNVYFEQNKVSGVNLVKNYGFDGLEIDIDKIAGALTTKYGEPTLKLNNGHQWNFENGTIKVEENYKRILVIYEMMENSNL